MNKKNKQQILIKLKAGVVVQYQNKILLIKELNNHTGKYGWNIIKGTFEPQQDATVMDTAVREAREEANAKIELRYLLGAYYLLYKSSSITMFTFVADLLNPKVFVSSKEEQAKYRRNEEIIEVKFFKRRELENLPPESFVGTRGYLAIRDYLSGKKYPLGLITVLPPR